MSELSTHKVEVVPVELEKHPNADTLSIVRVFGGYTCCVRTDDWVGVTKAAYLPPDSVVDTARPEFVFLLPQAKTDGKARIKAKKLRGIISFGLLIPMPDDAVIGVDMATALAVEHYEPTMEHEKRTGVCMGGDIAQPPAVYSVKYDVDAFRRYHRLFEPGEPVIVTEKLDGANSRYVFCDGQMHCGSHNNWKKQYPDYSHVTVEKLVAAGKTEPEAQQIIDRLMRNKKKNMWWDLLEKHPAIEEFCRTNPGVVVYAEAYGNVNSIKYGLPDGNRLAVFDLMKNGKWLNAEEARELGYNLPWVPCIGSEWHFNNLPGAHSVLNYGIPYDFETICQLAEGPTTVPDAKPGTMREGVVVKPLVERRDDHIGRVCFKCVSGAFLERYR